jgi:hypothetical protein
MAKELILLDFPAESSAFAIAMRPADLLAAKQSSEALEAFAAAAVADFAIALAWSDAALAHVADLPAWMAGDAWLVRYYGQAGANPAAADLAEPLGSELLSAAGRSPLLHLDADASTLATQATAAEALQAALNAGTIAGEARDAADAARAAVDNLRGPGGSDCTVAITEDGTPLGTPVADADVWISADAPGENVIAGTVQSNAAGQATFLLEPGMQYYLWAQKDGWNGVHGRLFVAEADE